MQYGLFENESGPGVFRFKHGSHFPKNRGFLRFSDVWDSYNQWEHRIPDIPDGRRFLRRDRKNRKHFYFEGPFQTVSDVGDFHDECEHEICLSGTSRMLEFGFSCYQSLISSEFSIINVLLLSNAVKN